MALLIFFKEMAELEFINKPFASGCVKLAARVGSEISLLYLRRSV
jgi:hypothetical protein